MARSQTHLPGVPHPPADPCTEVDGERVRVPTAIEMPSGCGGGTLGLQAFGFNVLAGVDVNRSAWYAYHKQIHNAEAIDHDMTDVDPDVFARLAAEADPDYEYEYGSTVPQEDYSEIGPEGPGLVDLALFGTPCQGASSSGKKDPDDERNELLFSAVEWVEELAPRAVMMENVPGLKKHHTKLHERLQGRLREAGPGYHVSTIIVNAADYGVPQRRRRLFVLAVRQDHDVPSRWTPQPSRSVEPQQTLTGRHLEGYETVSEALEDLPDPLEPQPPAEDPVHMVSRNNPRCVHPDTIPEPIDRDGETVWMPPNHVEADHDSEYRAEKSEVPLGYPGAPETDRRLHPEQAAPTMTVSSGTPPFHFDGRAPSKPDADSSDVRRLTVREVARIQGFPDSFTFPGTKVEQFRQAANAIPPLLTAQVVSNLWSSSLS